MDAEQLELSNIAGEDARWTSHFAKQLLSFLNIKLYIYTYHVTQQSYNSAFT